MSRDRSKWKPVTPEYRSWRHMIQRCASHPAYQGRGITVCERWRTYANFLADMGPRPSLDHSLDRVDNDGNYEPSNCRWASAKEQQRNTRSNRLLTFNGQTKCLMDWALSLGVKFNTLHERLRRGWSVERTLTTSIQGRQ